MVQRDTRKRRSLGVGSRQVKNEKCGKREDRFNEPKIGENQVFGKKTSHFSLNCTLPL